MVLMIVDQLEAFSFGAAPRASRDSPPLHSSRLSGPIGAHRRDLVLHGEAGGPGRWDDVPVRYVAIHVTREAFACLDL